ncbi:MAG: hypothetical protein JWP49_1129 [Phenylobacterium sp.]|jgi:hypothetical protein|nr:hypothetical protein [Phenylobacterium sp.]
MADLALRPFNISGYEILDHDLADGEMVIWSVNPVMPRLGDDLLIESRGRTYDVAVDALTAVKGGWSARCKVKQGAVRPPLRRPA